MMIKQHPEFSDKPTDKVNSDPLSKFLWIALLAGSFLTLKKDFTLTNKKPFKVFSRKNESPLFL